MSSPFSTFEEFEAALDGPTEGAIYTFANAPAINAIALLICVALFIWFIVRTFTIHYDVPSVDSSLSHLSAFIVAGLLSLAGMEYRHPTQPHVPANAQQPVTISPRQATRTPLGILGLAGIGLPLGQRTRRKRRYHRRISKL